MKVADGQHIVAISRSFPIHNRIAVLPGIILLYQLFPRRIENSHGGIQGRTELSRQQTQAVLPARPGCKTQVVGLFRLRYNSGYLCR